MNWKPSLIAAVIVTAAGLATGALLGGKTTTRIVRVPVAATPSATIAGTDTPTATATATATTAATPDSPPENGARADEPAQDAVFVSEDDVLGNDYIYETEVGVVAQLQRGFAMNNSIRLWLGPDDEGEPPSYWSLEISVAPEKTRFKAQVGFARGEPASNFVEVGLHEDRVDGVQLAHKKLAATEVHSIDQPVGNAAKVVVKLTPVGEWDGDDWTFVLAGARFE